MLIFEERLDLSGEWPSGLRWPKHWLLYFSMASVTFRTICRKEWTCSLSIVLELCRKKYIILSAHRTEPYTPSWWNKHSEQDGKFRPLTGLAVFELELLRFLKIRIDWDKNNGEYRVLRSFCQLESWRWELPWKCDLKI